jgi:ribonuclease HI
MNKKQMNIILPSINLKTSSVPKIHPSPEYALHFSGCCKGNPGSAGIGVVIFKNGIEHWVASEYIGDKRTKIETEYCALIHGLQLAKNLNIKRLSVCGDSLLVVNQINKIYKVKHPKLADLYDKTIELKTYFDYIDFNHVYRKDNKLADELSELGSLCNDDVEAETTICDIKEDIEDCEEKIDFKKIFTIHTL